MQELNEDGSPRLDDNGNPIFQLITEQTYYKLIETPIGAKRWRRVQEVNTVPDGMLKVEERRKTARKGINK